jgi:hypothetical protein
VCVVLWFMSPCLVFSFLASVSMVKVKTKIHSLDGSTYGQTSIFQSVQRVNFLLWPFLEQIYLAIVHQPHAGAVN